MKGPRIYRRLASARQFGVVQGGWVTLHLGPDHLLLRSSHGYVETYRRFYFADIEAITIVMTVRGIFWNGGLGLLLFFSVLPILLQRGPHYASGTCIAVSILLLTANIWRGTTCATFLQTRVQTRKLPLRRVRKALRVLDQLAPAIAAAQSDIVLAPPVATQVSAAPTRAADVSQTEPPPLPGDRVQFGTSPAHIVAFSMLVVTGAAALVAALQHYHGLVYVCAASLVVNIGLGVLALVQQRRRRLARAIRPIAWISVVAHGVAMPLVYIVYSFVMMVANVERRAPVRPRAQPAPQLTLSAMNHLPHFERLVLLYGTFCLLIGIVGLIIYAVQLATRSARSPNE